METASLPPTAPPDPWFADEVLIHESALRRWLQARFPRLEPDDLVQESFLRIIRANSTTPVVHPKTYLFTIARNLALNQIRHDRHEHRDALREIDPSTVIDDKPGIPETVARTQEQELLIEALQHLPERARQVFTLRRIYGLSLKEISAQLGISEKTTESHMSLALRRCADFVLNADARAPRTQPETPQPAPRSAVLPSHA
ncbi:MAG TPA: sigma-70 family RNA polymerase sigma factor [Opitutaceae bacterium]|nr:sigma-70 family RNA polymerase sigma factor [Opitutaceae bacterium]